MKICKAILQAIHFICLVKIPNQDKSKTRDMSEVTHSAEVVDRPITTELHIDKYRPTVTGGGDAPSCFPAHPAGSILGTNTFNQHNIPSNPIGLTLRSQVEHAPTTSSGVFLNVCFFCNKGRRKWKGTEMPLVYCDSINSQRKIEEAAETLNDAALQAKMGNVDFPTKQVKYHHPCKLEYLNKATQKEKYCERENSVHVIKCQAALDEICCYIQTTVIEKRTPEYLTVLHSRFQDHFRTMVSPDEDVIQPYTTSRRFKGALKRRFGEHLVFEKESNKEGIVVFSASMTNEEAFFKIKYASTVVQVALQLREEVMRLKDEAEELPSPLTIDSIQAGQADPPDLLLKFFEALYGGYSSHPSDKTTRQVSSSASDVVYIITNGHVKPSKHICMGLGVKSMTGSRKVIELLNHFGHCIGYHVAEELETELATNISDRGDVVPDGIVKEDGLAMSLAWDNYDELTETLSGKDTLHDTVGICYQNKCVNTNETSTRPAVSPSGGCFKKPEFEDDHMPRTKKRKFNHLESQLEPYIGKPSVKRFNFPLQENTPPTGLLQIQRKDQVWMMSCALTNNTPMWQGWNSLVTTDNLPMQRVQYMKNIHLPPTRLDVVRETLKRTQQVAETCKQMHIMVHYDLAIAKLALQIQSSEAPRFDNIFIGFGPFHIEMTYFACLGYYLDASGGPQILNDVGVLAQGSMNGFLSGRHYNRCRRIHSLLATAIDILHFRSFLDHREQLPATLTAMMQPDVDAKSLDDILESPIFASIMDEYEAYSHMTRSGVHGATAKYWMTYVDLIRTYRVFERACRTNDVQLFTYALGCMCKVFFSANRPNYSRWMVFYHMKLLNITNSFRNLLENGALSIRRTPKNFARSAVDITLEQTVNKDSASRQTGIAAFSSSVSARTRWTITRPIRAAIVGHLLHTAGLTNQEDITQKELQPTRIKRDNRDLSKIIQGFETTMNPFNTETKDNTLYCISTCRATSKEVAKDLLAFTEKGAQWCDEFQKGCTDDVNRFQKPIKRRKVKNFTHDSAKMKLTTKDRKVKEVRCTRDLFGRLLYLASLRKLDLREVLHYPLLQVPLSLSHYDGSKHRTDKAQLMAKLEGVHVAGFSGSRTQQAKADCYIVDMMFYLRTIHSLPDSFAGVARRILADACSLASTVHLVCDRYDLTPNIKDVERASRGDHEGKYNISGGGQKRPSNFDQLLLSSSFKVAFLRFLGNEWQSDDYVDVLRHNTVYLGIDQICYMYRVEEGKMTRTIVEDLTCNHNEADTRILFHTMYITAAGNSTSPTIAVRASDTDVFVLLLHHVNELNATVWMDVGFSANNTRRSISITNLAQVLGKDICCALPAFHAFTGCDYTASFMRKGKVRPFDIMSKSREFISAFKKLGDSSHIEDDVEDSLEAFVCAIYGQSKERSINEARYTIFCRLYAPKDINSPMKKLKSSDPACLPPCKKVLIEKIRRANYTAMLWKSATKSTPIDLSPESHGWKLAGDKSLELRWYNGPSCPETLEEIETDEIEEDDDDVYLSDNDENDDEDEEESEL